LHTSKALHNPVSSDAPCSAPHHGAEVLEFHTRLLRTSLAAEECRAYWEHVRPDIPRGQRAVVAFEERWFGNKSMARVRELLATFRHRFDAYPVALEVLRRWRPSDPATRRNICHWHMQLTDPLYRAFTGSFLEQRRLHPHPKVDREVTVRWMQHVLDDRWGAATTIRIATSLLTSAAAAGLCAGGTGARRLFSPKVTDEALAYLLYMLRHLSFAGSLLENPYVASVGLAEGILEQRLRRLPGLSFHRMGELCDFGWQHADLKAWAMHGLGLPWEDEA
jgi:hypothetical protein